MDIIAHGVYNIALQKTIKNLQTRKEILIAFLWGILPDLVPFAIPFMMAIFSGSFGHHGKIVGFDIANTIYPYTHSIVVFGVVFLVLYFIRKQWYLPMLGWGLHVALDMPLHSPDFFPTPFLFPISTYIFPYGISWGTPLVWLSTWVVASLWLIWIYLKKIKKRFKVL